MVAVIKTGSSLRRIFHYNEQKVREGVAECILAANYPKDAACLTPGQRLHRLQLQAALNENVTRNSVHISLNFHPGEQLPQEQLQEIARAYMEKIGFGNQPYLVYRHTDAGHPHIHLVSVKVRADGSRIDMHNIGRRQSEQARKAIEERFGLVKAADAALRPDLLKAETVQQVRYGHTDTRRAVQRVLDAVLPHYRYTSFAELNAVLGLYRVKADRGSEYSRVYRYRGLCYRVLDENGQPVGVPIKASAFHRRPTLPYLEERFTLNEKARLPYKARLRGRIDLALLRHPPRSVQELVNTLARENIHLVLRQNAEGLIYGMTYVDHQARCVFNGSTLGKAYSAKAMLERSRELTSPEKQSPQIRPPEPSGVASPTLPASQTPQPDSAFVAWGREVRETLLAPGQTQEAIPYQFRRKRKQKKRKRVTGPS